MQETLVCSQVEHFCPAMSDKFRTHSRAHSRLHGVADGGSRERARSSYTRNFSIDRRPSGPARLREARGESRCPRVSIPIPRPRPQRRRASDAPL